MADPELVRFTLPNGLRVVLAPDPTSPVIGVSVHYDVGFRSEPEGRTGFAHLFEHLMFQGSESLEKLAHFRHVQSSGGTFNGSTHPDYTDYFMVLPSAGLERALFLEADRMRAPKLTEENLRNQIDVVKEEIRLNVLNRPYGGVPLAPPPPVRGHTLPPPPHGSGRLTDIARAGGAAPHPPGTRARGCWARAASLPRTGPRSRLGIPRRWPGGGCSARSRTTWRPSLRKGRPPRSWPG